MKKRLDAGKVKEAKLSSAIGAFLDRNIGLNELTKIDKKEQ